MSRNLEVLPRLARGHEEKHYESHPEHQKRCRDKGETAHESLRLWLARHSRPKRMSPPFMGSPETGLVALADAPGTYVLQR